MEKQIGELIEAARKQKSKMNATLKNMNSVEAAEQVDKLSSYIKALCKPERKFYSCPGNEDVGCCNGVAIEMQGNKFRCATCWHEFVPCLEVRFIEDDDGCGYGDEVRTHIPVSLIKRLGLEKGFKRKTGYPSSAITGSEEDIVFDEDGNELETEPITIEEIIELTKEITEG